MRNLFFLALIFFTKPGANSQTPYWQQEVNFHIDVSLNDVDHTLDGFAKIEYINNSPDTLKFIWFHLWPNAYKNDKTAFSEQLLKNGNTHFYFSDLNQRGYINRLDFRIENRTAATEDHPEHIDIVKLILPAPLPPGKKILITTPFHVKLPFNFSRGGHEGQSYQATQWYPKPAVYDKNGWHPMPYLDQGEFYSEFGSFEVTINVPKNYVVAATGVLLDESEKSWLKTRAGFNWTAKDPGKQIPNKSNIDSLRFPPSDPVRKTIRFKQDRIHDFAWFADKRFIVDSDTCQIASGRIIDVISYYTPAQKEIWKNSVSFSKKALRHYAEKVGDYGYPVVQVVQGPDSFGGGMEYPTITVISPTESASGLDHTIAHEIGHNWFFGMLASNERKHPWMDEGINSYFEELYKSGETDLNSKQEQLIFETKALLKTDQACDLSSEKYSEQNYGLSVYYKSAEWMRYLESRLGKEVLEKAVQHYFKSWQFKHPQPEDFKRSIEESTGRNLDEEFAWLQNKGVLPTQKRSGTSTLFFPGIKALKSYIQNPKKELITAGPALGVNSYDQLMIGGFITNHKLPPSSIQFFLAPMYATGSKKITGLGNISYTFYPDGLFRKISLGIKGALFTADQFIDNNSKKNYLGYSNIVPGIKLTFKEKNPLSSFTRFIRLRSFLIREDGLRFSRDTISPGPPAVVREKYSITKTNRSLFQLQAVVENNRALYPYNGELKIESGTNFLRAAFTGNYFFNFPKSGGLSLRFFAGKFIYTGSKTPARQFSTSRYHLNLSGPNGYEDYTYSDYYAGRNYFENWQSQQMSLRDGAFKVRTDFLAQKVGNTDDWLAAVNIESTIPQSINPFRLLPVPIPVKLFLDIGTYAETWKQNAQTDHFLFDAGLCFPLLKDNLTIYVPLIYSSVYGDYYKSTIAKKERFWKKIIFCIDISHFSLRKISRNLSF